jgi:heat shock protein HtpX
MGALYVVSLIVAFSPVAEKIMRLFNNVRPLEMKEEKDFLLPIFNEVLDKAKEQNPEEFADSNIELFIIDSMSVNACAIGKNTIAVTKGAMKTFSADELRGIFAHEIAHILNRDTIAPI